MWSLLGPPCIAGFLKNNESAKVARKTSTEVALFNKVYDLCYAHNKQEHPELTAAELFSLSVKDTLRTLNTKLELKGKEE